MNDPRRQMRCVRCNKEFEINQVRYIPDRSGVACLACLGIVQKEHAAKREAESRLYGFQCVSCRYMFYRGATNSPESCPQCGKKDFLKFQKDKLTADTLLKIADDPRLKSLEE